MYRSIKIPLWLFQAIIRKGLWSKYTIIWFFSQFSLISAPPSGLVLEAPFYNISLAAKEYMLAPLILNNRWIIQKCDEALEAINLRMATYEK